MMNSNRTKTFLRLIHLTAGLLITGCAVSSLDSGGSSGTEVSVVSGMVVDQNGNPVKNAAVRFRPVDYLSDSAQSAAYASAHSLIDTTTGIDGRFSISRMLPDSYTIEIACDDTFGAFSQFRSDTDIKQMELPTFRVLPLACLSGTVQFVYPMNAYVSIQVYGLDRTVVPDSLGNFSIVVPQGSHKVHIGGYLKDSVNRVEFDGMDLSCTVGWGEDKNIGNYFLKPPPPPPCIDGSCDSAVVRHLLDIIGFQMVRMTDVARMENGRIVELNLRGLPLMNGIPSDINRLVELRVLDLGQTGLPFMFTEIARMTKLEIIRMDGCHIPMFSINIGKCAALKEIDLYGNELTELPQSIVNLNNLTYLNVGDNHFCTVDSTMGAWIDKYDPTWRTNQRCQ
jgi:hypothetical protein